jgi:hypothetical protein
MDEAEEKEKADKEEKKMGIRKAKYFPSLLHDAYAEVR